jgi:L,D-peptidoglycan transpeptidase YkuD (ErfK/YbiS/YcfS/YnhG family)
VLARTVPVLLLALALSPTADAEPSACRPATGASSQLITVETSGRSSTRASLRLWAREGRCWSPVAGPWAARVGRSGLSKNRREGDGTTPTGTYAIGRTMYGVAPDPGVRYRYRRIVCGDYWVEDPSSPSYNRFRHVPCGQAPPFRVTGERLWQATTAYRHFAVIEFNTNPVVPGRGSGIFLHASTGRATNGCVSLPLAQLRQVLRWLRPDQAPRIQIRVTTA